MTWRPMKPPPSNSREVEVYGSGTVNPAKYVYHNWWRSNIWIDPEGNHLLVWSIAGPVWLADAEGWRELATETTAVESNERRLALTFEEAQVLLSKQAKAVVASGNVWAVVVFNEDRDAYVWDSGRDWETWEEAASFGLDRWVVDRSKLA